MARIGIRVVFILGFGMLVLLMQLLAVSRLGPSTSKYPWEDHKPDDSEGLASVQKRTLQPPPLEHENPDAVLKAEEEALKQQQSQIQNPDPPLQQQQPQQPQQNSPSEKPERETFQETKNRVISKYKNMARGLRDVDQVRDTNLSQYAERVRPSSRPPPPSTASIHRETAHKTKDITALVHHPLPSELQMCDISSKKDAQSAISRASTDECKALIHNVTCLQKYNRLYDNTIANQCPINRNPGRSFQYKPYAQGTGPPIRIVYLLSVHGRPYRQMKRLFKAIYHADHYFFIHVDSRSDYLHRKLYEDLSDFPNVYFPTWRMATIWGGASLLQMLLRSMEDLEYVLTDWSWDFFINLSESDYPLQTNEHLVQFLRVHRGSNFIKTHGGDVKKFIQKQGLDRTFVECDNHMWRVDSRPLPSDITIDGGSDWITVNRNYSHYIITNRGHFLTGLKRYYEFSLLPAESFFHTAIRNGPLCESFVKTNLRVTNWNRKLGCRCQYKHIVDWCGCSPNDFLARDFGKIKNPGDHHFFARKFEAIVNQEIVGLLDQHLYGDYPEDTPALKSYWESVYHVDDDITKPSNGRYSTYQSFLRQGLKLLYDEDADKGNTLVDCGIPKQAVIKDINVFEQSDQFSGLVVTLRDELSESFTPPEFELFYSPTSHVTRYSFDGDLAKRIWALEIGSEWDGKESIFRNYGGVLGAWDEPVAALRLTVGKQGDVKMIWDDPVGERVANYAMKLEAGWFVSYHKPKLERPIRPGVWTVKLEMPDGALIMENKFLVAPITHENKQPLNRPKALSINARRTHPQPNGIDPQEFKTWQRYVSQDGTALEQWMDKLVAQFWLDGEYCRTGVDPNGRCSWIPDCSEVHWSTFSSDPKSEIGKLQSNGRLR